MLSLTNYTAKQVAQITNKDEETIRKWLRSGKLKGRKPIGCRDWIIRKDDFDLFYYGELQPDVSA